jgi:hypothetical protein
MNSLLISHRRRESERSRACTPRGRGGLEFTRTDTLVIRNLMMIFLVDRQLRAKSPASGAASELGTLLFELNFARELA